MFGRRDEAPEATPAPEPTTPVGRREKVEAKDARIFTTGHTFAERKARADAAKAVLSQRRLVSLGATEFPSRNRRTGQVEYLPAELLANLDHPAERFIRINGDTQLTPLQSDNRTDEVTELPANMPRRPGLSVMHEPSQPDPPARPV